MTVSSRWRVLGFNMAGASSDPSSAYYPIATFNSEAEARQRADELVAESERREPGSQGPIGTGDIYFVVRPDGSQYRVLPGGKTADQQTDFLGEF